MLISINELLTIFTLATILVGLFYLPAIKTGINLADEGYLWHGTLRVLAGEIPIRDFRAYDPGRYYWCALWMYFLGHNLLSLRIVMLITQLLALTIGLAAVHIATGTWLATALMGLAVMAWMYPVFKQVDILFSMTTPLIAILLVDNPITSQYILSGMYVGVCFFFGLNHAIYAGGGISLLILIMGLTGYEQALTDSFSSYVAGAGLGLLPALIALFFVPRLFKIYWQQKISRIFKRKTANLPLPVPWLWKSEISQLAQINKGGQLIVKCMFTFMPVIYAATFLPLLLSDAPTSGWQWYLIAIACSGFFYLHHAFSRADLNHLSQSIAPLIMLLVIFFANFSYGWVAMAGLIAVSLRYIYLHHTIWIGRLFSTGDLQQFKIGEDTLWLNTGQANYLGRLRNLIETHSKPEDFVLLLPTFLTLYPMLKRKPPVYNLFCVYPATEEEESKMIGELSAHEISFILISNVPLDNREELRFSQTHPNVWQYINREFHILSEENMPHDHYAFVK